MKKLNCPECNSNRIFRDGFRYTNNGQVQRFLCRDCGFRFSNNPYIQCQTKGKYQLCVLEAKKLDFTTEKQTVAGESRKEIKGKIVWFIWEMQKQNYSKDTIITYSRCIKNLIKRADLSDPESVKEALAKWKCGESHKHNITAAYILFLKMHGKTWNPPIFRVKRKLPFIPTEKELNDLIAATGIKTSVFLQTLKETAMRSGECSRLKWDDIDFQRKTIILNEAEKNGNPRILKIGLHTFRHWKATMLYHETHDIVYVKEFLGHKTLDVTLLYIQIEKVLFRNEAENFHVKATKETDEIQGLLEAGFKYQCQKNDLMFFRKRK